MTHSTGNTVGVEGITIPTGVVEDYSIVERDDSTRPAVYASGDLYTSLSTTRETDFDFNFFDFFLPVNGGPPPHYHPFEHEIWHITDGEFQFNLGDQGELGIVVPEGTTVFGPINKTHGYRNLDSTASVIGVTPGARTLSMTTPGALDLFFDFAAQSVIDRDAPIPTFGEPLPEDFINLAKFSARTNAGITLLALDPNYQPPEDALDYVLVLPEDATGEVVEQAIELKGIDGFSVWTTGEQEGLPQRPTFTGEFDIEYTSLTSLEESGDKFAYDRFELDPEATEISVDANLSGSQVVEPTESSATGNVTLDLNDAGDIEYSLTVTGLDFGELVEGESAQTPENELDDVTMIHIHAAESGTNGSHAFNILDPHEQQESDLDITLNDDGSATISGVWNQSEQEIPEDLTEFIDRGGAPESDYYFQVHTTGNETGEIRGQISLETTTDFPDPVTSQEHQLFYVNEGRLAVEINGEVEIADRDTYVHIAPGNEYAIANFSNETVEALSISIPTLEEPNMTGELYPSPVTPLGNIPTNRQVFLGDEADFFNESQKTNLYRYVYDVAPGFTDFTVEPITIDNVEYDGTFINAAINPSTQELVFANGVYQVLEGDLGKPEGLIEILREDYAVAGREGVIALEFYNTTKDLDTVADEVAQLPQDTQDGLSPDTVVTLPFGELVEQYDWLVIPAEEFAFDVFRDSAGNPTPIVGTGWSVEEYESRRQIFAGGGDDEIYATKEDKVFGEGGNDFIDASGGLGRNRLYGNEGDDSIFVNVSDRAFGGDGNDFINAAVGVGQPGETISGGNYIDGGNGSDYLLAGSNSELHGGNGNDTLQISDGGGNLLYGEAGSDEFWIAKGQLPDAVAVEYPEGTDALLPEGVSLPELVDTRNTIMDFELGVDRIYISDIEGVSSFEDLQLLPAFGDLGSTSIATEFTEDGTSKEISLANVAGVIFNELTADDFIFA
ncbi:CHRD domain-containing protein [Pleurocapsales cyanobacterium LEGE 10410]|nr:CHRD domain-containing protein [Pleurocapsales cyanobacterium LEGE 10410]